MVVAWPVKKRSQVCPMKKGSCGHYVRRSMKLQELSFKEQKCQDLISGYTKTQDYSVPTLLYRTSFDVLTSLLKSL